ncbi:MAG: 8-amino-7-oxononanoate synthase [Gammaproteobacteria bacterium]|nr:8-amino-7-oxononanoate synthase [Gammaproteobacteria bacterium]MXY58578.1 8-amino-7-oxononanoate synthase [Gammaproteobacteria bacterium]MYF31157.1 8-amino-7-oxononanoate synthase [Gammaproteobacteria bacterium]MYK45434.1 8-amino-7-oxononanoate synthase [Gammaproteobacteria bacterium]
MRHGQGFSDLESHLDDLRRRHMYRVRRSLEGPQGREVVVDGRPLLNFCSNDYLGLAGDSRIAEAFKRGIDRWGTGSGASHLICGHTGAHVELEDALAEFTGRPRALLFGSGYAANVGVINALLSIGDFVFEDRLNHASLLDGGWISRATFSWFEHRDTADLEGKLAAIEHEPTRKLVVSDGTFSMDGDPCRLDELVELAQRRAAWIMIDDAHGIGVHGVNGAGLVDPARYGTTDVPVLVGTLGKAFGTAGAFVAGEEALIEFLVQRSRNYIFTTAMPSALAVATLESLAIAKAEPERRERLAALIARFRNGSRELGLKLMPSTSPIQPVVVGDPARALALSRALEARGFLIGAIRPPTVPEGTSRLRVTLTAAHRPSDVDRLLESLKELAVCTSPDQTTRSGN